MHACVCICADSICWNWNHSMRSNTCLLLKQITDEQTLNTATAAAANNQGLQSQDPESRDWQYLNPMISGLQKNLQTWYFFECYMIKEQIQWFLILGFRDWDINPGIAITAAATAAADNVDNYDDYEWWLWLMLMGHLKMQDWKMTDEYTGLEFVGLAVCAIVRKTVKWG